MVVPAPGVYEYRVAGRALRLSGLRYAECEGDARGGALAAAGHATGAAQWPAGTLLCDYLSAALGAKGLRGARVVELGCGLGMCGVVAAALAGPSGSVLLTDGAPLHGGMKAESERHVTILRRLSRHAGCDRGCRLRCVCRRQRRCKRGRRAGRALRHDVAALGRCGGGRARRRVGAGAGSG